MQVYKNLLTNIKNEYEFCIKELENSQSDVDNAEEEIIKLQCGANTLFNLEKRKVELEFKYFGKKH